jgi:hypothetical protein
MVKDELIKEALNSRTEPLFGVINDLQQSASTVMRRVKGISSDLQK